MKTDSLNIPKERNKEVHINVEENKQPVQVNVDQNNKEIHVNIEEDNKDVHPSEDVDRLVIQKIVSSLTDELDAVPDAYVGFIYKISEKHRKLKEESYTPRVVSIGPLHHGKSHLQAMEAYKLRCLKYFISKFKISLTELTEYATFMESTVRACYEDFEFKPEEFSKMILLDGIFLIQVFVKNEVQMTGQADVLNQNSWKVSDIMHDMLLLENQLPLFFISGLLSILDPNHKKESYEDSSDNFGEAFENPTENFEETFEHPTGYFQETFLKHSLEYFKEVGITKRLIFTPECKDAWHLVHFLITLHVPSNTKLESTSKGRFAYSRSASELQKAGVRFDNVMGGLFEVSFNKKAGLLRIPQLTVNDTTETFFRNLIAFEQCENEDKFITSYIIFMDSLINTAEDVELLAKHKIINNLLGENQLVADLFNNLYKEVIEDQRKFCFADICKDLDEYSKDCFHRWKSSWFKWKLILKNNYFNNPWSVVSFIAALIAIILTIVQTVCSILGL